MEIPKDAPHQFTEIDMHLLSTQNYISLLKISHFAKENGTSLKLKHLNDALKKYQWFVIALNNARQIEATLRDFDSCGNLLMDPTAQSIFSKSIYEIVIYGKASIDSLAMFISDYFDLNLQHRQCDFKWADFRSKFNQLDICSGLMDELEDWLKKDSEETSSISSTRDHWIHREYITTLFLWPPNELGCLVVPKSFDAVILKKVTFETHYSAEDFTQLYSHNLSKLLDAVINKVEITEANGKTISITEDLSQRVSFFPLVVTVESTWGTIQLGPFSARQIKE